MSLLQSKQIKKLLAARARFEGFTTSAASSENITIALTAALSTAGNGGVAVPLQVQTGENPGVIALGTHNKVEIWNDATEERIVDGNGKEVYGRVTEAAGVYTVSYFVLDAAGVQQAYTFPAITTLNMEIPYAFEFVDFPMEAPIAVRSRNVSDDPAAGANGTHVVEVRTPTAVNTIPDLTSAPNLGAGLSMRINGQVISANLAGTGLAVDAAGVVTITQNDLGFPVNTTDEVIFEYFTFA